RGAGGVVSPTVIFLATGELGTISGIGSAKLTVPCNAVRSPLAGDAERIAALARPAARALRTAPDGEPE
ncbi:hypothetical protein, partial [Bacteroides thetaiotaomicron]|uniref:hypothetical protein n=1 Tax=Bacteroides thetaiotaomicron TaxID=818 RepID=UPI001D06E310